jgi:hypothetical protein
MARRQEEEAMDRPRSGLASAALLVALLGAGCAEAPGSALPAGPAVGNVSGATGEVGSSIGGSGGPPGSRPVAGGTPIRQTPASGNIAK